MSNDFANSPRGIVRTTNYRNTKEQIGVDAFLRESDQGLKFVQKFVSMTSYVNLPKGHETDI